VGLLPESLTFLALKRTESPGSRETPAPWAAVAALFKDGRGLPSALLWTAVTLGYFALYFVISWIPKLVTQAGLPLSQAIYAGATYNLGAFVGTAAVGWIAVRFPLHRVIATYLGLAAVTLLVFGGFSMPVWLTLLVALCVGVTVQGGFNGFWALSAACIRPTCVTPGWAGRSAWGASGRSWDPLSAGSWWAPTCPCRLFSPSSPCPWPSPRP
jgi:AAHS family 4-hydroxybenzoate transporter-like MFS transporter